MLSGLAEIARDLLILVGAMTTLLAVLVLVVWKMSDANPAKRMLKLLAYRFGATVLAGAGAVPIEPIPIADAIYDFGIPIVLIWYWFTLFRDLRRPSRNGYPGPRASLDWTDQAGFFCVEIWTDGINSVPQEHPIGRRLVFCVGI